MNRVNLKEEKATTLVSFSFLLKYHQQIKSIYPITIILVLYFPPYKDTKNKIKKKKKTQFTFYSNFVGTQVNKRHYVSIHSSESNAKDAARTKPVIFTR